MQAIVQIHGGTAFLSSCGRGPTLWRARGQPWVSIENGDQVPLTNGDEVSLDCNAPEAVIFTCEEEGNMQQQDGYAHQAQPQLPYPWEQLVDPNGNAYYSNAQTGQVQWEPPQQGAW